jgi:hypothetical protein
MGKAKTPRGGRETGAKTGATRTSVRPLALFVEGAAAAGTPDHDNLSKLWTTLCKICRIAQAPRVVGFSKNHLAKMADPPDVQMAGQQPLHLLVAQHYDREPFRRAIVAFDALPANQAVVPANGMRGEVNFVLQCFEGCEKLPEAIRKAARSLLHWYEIPCAQRSVRAPGALEIIYMNPSFEALLVSDEASVRRALVGEGERLPSEWPTFNQNERHPEQHILPQCVDCARREARVIVRGSFKTNKHAWAEYILRHVRHDSDLLNHEIAARLAVIAA